MSSDVLTDRPQLTVASIRTAAQPVLDRLRATVGEREERRDFAFDEVRRLAEIGVLLTGIGVEDGGAGGDLRDVLELVLAIARADSSVAQALRGSFGTAFAVSHGPASPAREETLQRIREGHFFAGTVNERNGGAGGTVTTTLRRDDDGFVVHGEKYYSTGALYASWFSGTATTEEGSIARFQVPLDREGVQRLDDFDAIGQRLTASGTTRLTQVRLSDEEVDLGEDGPPVNPWGGLGHLYLCAVQAGIAYAVLDDAVRFAREQARPIKHSSADTSVDDPYVQHTVGEIASRATTLRAAVLVAAEELQAVVELPGTGATDDEVRRAGAQVSITIAQTQAVAAESTLRAAELLFDVGGGSATARELGFDRHWRNARVVANHNPRDWKLAKVGAWLLTGEEPPTSGLF